MFGWLAILHIMGPEGRHMVFSATRTIRGPILKLYMHDNYKDGAKNEVQLRLEKVIFY